MGVQHGLTTAGVLGVILGGVLLSGGMAGSPTWAQPKPPGDRPGCYAKMVDPPVYKTIVEHTAAAPTVSYRDRPAVTEHYNRRVLVSPARVAHRSLPAVYKTVWRWTKAFGPAREVVSPPVYGTVAERRLIAPAHLEWRPGGVAHGFGGAAGFGGDPQQARPTGEVLCRVLVPARYAWSRRQTLVTPARRYTVNGPVRHVRTEERVLLRPARIVDRAIPAVYRTEDAVRTVKPAGRRRLVTPGAVKRVTRRVLVRPARLSWAPIVCVPHPRVSAPPPAHGPVRTPMPKTVPAPAPAPVPAPMAGDGRSAPPATVDRGGGYGRAAVRPGGRAYRPDDIVAPVPAYPPHMRMPPPPASAPGMSLSGLPLTPAPYDVGHPAR